MINKTILCWILIAAATLSASAAGRRGGDVHVRGYSRSNGTYVQPHMRSAPDGNFYNNWTTRGNVNPYTGVPGTRVTPGRGRTYGVSPSVTAPSPSDRIETSTTRQGEVERSEYNKADSGSSTWGIPEWENYLRTNPSFPNGYAHTGYLYFFEKHYDSSIASLSRAIQADKQNNVLFHNRGMAYLFAGDYDKAIADFQESIRLKPESSYSNLGLGWAYKLKGRALKAAEDKREASNQPQSLQPHLAGQTSQ